MIDQIPDYNRSFVVRKSYEQYIADKNQYRMVNHYMGTISVAGGMAGIEYCHSKN